MKTFKKALKCLGVGAIFSSLCLLFYTWWSFAHNMIGGNNYFLKIIGFAVLLCMSAIAIFIMVMVISLFQYLLKNKLTNRDEIRGRKDDF